MNVFLITKLEIRSIIVLKLILLNDKKTLVRQLAAIQMKGPIALRPYLLISLLLIGKSFYNKIIIKFFRLNFNKNIKYYFITYNRDK